METFYVPKPEWYFLYSFIRLWKAFHGWLEPVGTIGVPLILTLLFLFLPFIRLQPRSESSPPSDCHDCLLHFCSLGHHDGDHRVLQQTRGCYGKPGRCKDSHHPNHSINLTGSACSGFSQCKPRSSTLQLPRLYRLSYDSRQRRCRRPRIKCQIIARQILPVAHYPDP